MSIVAMTTDQQRGKSKRVKPISYRTRRGRKRGRRKRSRIDPSVVVQAVVRPLWLFVGMRVPVVENGGKTSVRGVTESALAVVGTVICIMTGTIQSSHSCALVLRGSYEALRLVLGSPRSPEI